MLKLRVITALVIAPLMLLAIFAEPRWIGAAVLSLLVLLGAWEWSAFPGIKRVAARILYAALIGTCVVVLWWLGIAARDVDFVLQAALCWWLLAAVWIAFLPEYVNRFFAALAGLLVLVPAWLALVRLHAHDSRPDGAYLLLFLLLLVVAADVGAYFAGKRFGRHKLAPRVSPGKTWEGACGGLLAAVMVAAVGAFWFHLQWTTFVLLCLFVAFASIVGDLTESLFKRHAGLKDSGSLLPGHGGILDRVDSVTAAAPVFLVGLERLGMFS